MKPLIGLSVLIGGLFGITGALVGWLLGGLPGEIAGVCVGWCFAAVVGVWLGRGGTH